MKHSSTVLIGLLVICLYTAMLVHKNNHTTRHCLKKLPVYYSHLNSSLMLYFADYDRTNFCQKEVQLKLVNTCINLFHSTVSCKVVTNFKVIYFEQ